MPRPQSRIGSCRISGKHKPHTHERGILLPSKVKAPQFVGGQKRVARVKHGYNVSIVQEPETSFNEDVTATKRTLALQGGPCILVGHSYGGAVITEAGMDPSVAGLVYIAADMPDVVRTRRTTESASQVT
jgi:pimeloyl-ACP methyl ester carboxylesterase